MPTQYVALPALGSPQRARLVEQIANAFGAPRDGQFGMDDRDAQLVYDQLSQLSYHDRITLLREVFRHQGITVIEEISDPERAVRIGLLNRLGHGADQRPNFAGVNRFFNLMADAPQDSRYEGLLRGEINVVICEFGEENFTDRLTPAVEEPCRVFMRGTGVTTPGNPYQRLRSIGIIPGNPPSRRPPLPVVAAPAYQAVPAVNTQARRDLVDRLVRACGQPQTRDEGFVGFQDPETFFRLMANYSYDQRLVLFREVLRAQGWNDVAALPERNLRLHLMNRFMHNAQGETTYAGVDRFFRFVSDAPRDTAHRQLLQGEVAYLMTDVDCRQFVDRTNPGIQDNYRRFFCIGGRNASLLTADPYNRLELVGIPIGRPPVLPAAPPPMAIVPQNAMPAGFLGDFPSLNHRRPTLDFSLPPPQQYCMETPLPLRESYIGPLGSSPLVTV